MSFVCNSKHSKNDENNTVNKISEKFGTNGKDLKEWLMESDENDFETSKKGISKNLKETPVLQCEFCHLVLSTTINLRKHKLTRCKENARPDPSEIYATSMFNEKTSFRESMGDPTKECDFIRIYGVCNQESSKKGIKLEKSQRKSKRTKSTEELKNDLVCNCKPLNCPICHRRFNLRRSMISHLKINHKWTIADIQKLKFDCSLCKAVFWKKEDLEAHINNIHIREFKCSICETVFKLKSSLKAHIEYVHEGKKKDKCDICNKEFQGKIALHEHIVAVHFSIMLLVRTFYFNSLCHSFLDITLSTPSCNFFLNN